MTYLVVKATCEDTEKPLYEGAFFFTRTMLFPPLDKRNTRNKAKGLRITSERHIGELGVRCLLSPTPKTKKKPPLTDVTSSVSGGYPVGYLLRGYAYSL